MQLSLKVITKAITRKLIAALHMNLFLKVSLDSLSNCEDPTLQMSLRVEKETSFWPKMKATSCKDGLQRFDMEVSFFFCG